MSHLAHLQHIYLPVKCAENRITNLFLKRMQKYECWNRDK